MTVALANAEIEPPAGEQIDGRRLFGEQHRIVPRQHDHGGAEPQGLGPRGGPGQKIETRRKLTEAGEMVLDNKDAVVTERLGFDDVIHPLAKALAAVEIGAASSGQS